MAQQVHYVRVYHATRTYHTEDMPAIPKTIINITEVIPGSEADHPQRTLEEIRDFYRAQAKEIAAGLMASLPQGTLHELMIELLHSYACVYRGPTADAGPLMKTGRDGILT